MPAGDYVLGEVAEEKFYLTGEDIILLDLRKSLTVKTRAKGALVIGKLDQSNLRILLAFEKSIRTIGITGSGSKTAISTRRAFMFVAMFSSRAETGAVPQIPIITIPAD
jgi:hypothetical protein